MIETSQGTDDWVDSKSGGLVVKDLKATRLSALSEELVKKSLLRTGLLLQVRSNVFLKTDPLFVSSFIFFNFRFFTIC